MHFSKLTRALFAVVWFLLFLSPSIGDRYCLLLLYFVVVAAAALAAAAAAVALDHLLLRTTAIFLFYSYTRFSPTSLHLLRRNSSNSRDTVRPEPQSEAQCI